ncbi:MAG TPA: type III polyketide synthase [Puia sp.]|nr:type III polyketide synthase [Puia sp.]
MSTIISIGTAVPVHRHRQEHILPFMQRIYGLEKATARKLKALYHQSAIDTRYSVIPDYSLPADQWKFYPPTENLEPFPSLEKRMRWYREHAAALSLKAIQRCLGDRCAARTITHLITVSCTGMSAPGLDLELVDALGLPPHIFRTSVNFMGCYAAVHALKLANALAATPGSQVLIVCTELCTLHFQQEPTLDNLLSSLLFADGAAAALIVSDDVLASGETGLRLKSFYSEIVPEGKSAMTWGLSSTGFQMTLTGYVTDLIRADFGTLVGHALENSGISRERIGAWCIHPGGKRILDAIGNSLSFTGGELDTSYAVLRQYGNMSSSTILFVLQQLMEKLEQRPPNCIFGAAFGPGLTMETFVAEPI